MNEPESSLSAEAAAVALLAWYKAAGVDEAVGEDAIDWLARGNAGPGAGFRLNSDLNTDTTAHAGAARDEAPSTSSGVLTRGTPPAAQTTTPPSGTVRQFPTASPDEAVMSARAAARDAPDLEALRVKLETFNGCALKATAKNLCFFRGSPRARLMIIGEAPGREEDLAGIPFVGPAGKLLDRMLSAAGLSEADVHITNTVYWRPPGNRTPSSQETQACRPFLDRQIELVEPEIIALLGGAAANAVLGLPGGIMKLRGTWRGIEVDGHNFKTIASLHPAFLLRSPAYKRQAWRDMLTIAEALGVPTGVQAKPAS